jgi:hypothetical protein
MKGILKRTALLAIAALLPLSGLAQQATPKDPKSPVPGAADGRGPSGPVELKILAPKPDEVIPVPPPAAGQAPAKGAPVEVKFELKGFETFQDPATKSGQYIALFLDHIPYFSHWDAAKPWLFKNVPSGSHTLRAVVARPWNESIKEPGGFATVTFHVGGKDGKNTPAPGEPMLTVLQPRRGARYSTVQAQRLMLDFFVSGCTVGEDTVPNSCRVRYKLDDKPEVILTKPGPSSLEGLAAGKHAYVVGLTRGGKVAPGEYALVSGTFEIEPGSLMVPTTGEPATSSAPPSTAPGQPGPGGGASEPAPTPRRPAP